MGREQADKEEENWRAAAARGRDIKIRETVPQTSLFSIPHVGSSRLLIYRQWRNGSRETGGLKKVVWRMGQLVHGSWRSKSVLHPHLRRVSDEMGAMRIPEG